MIRRSRISVRPNVKPTGRAAATSRETSQGNETSAAVVNDAGVKAGGDEVVTEAIDEVKATPVVPAAETNEKTESKSNDLTSQSDLSVTAAEVAGQSASSSSLSMRRKRFSVLPNLRKPRTISSSTLTSSKLLKSPSSSESTTDIPSSSNLTSSKLLKSPVTSESTPEIPPASFLTSSKLLNSPVRPESTPEIPPASTNISLDVSESPDKHRKTQGSVPDALPVSTKSLLSPGPRLPSSLIHNTSRASKLSSNDVNTTEKSLSAPVSAPKLSPAPLVTSKHRQPNPVTPKQDNVATSSSRLDGGEAQLGSQDVAESSCPNEEVHCEQVSVSKSQNEHKIQDGSELSSPRKNKKPQQHVPLALRTVNDPMDRLRIARARKLRELLRKELNKGKKEKHQRSQTGTSELKLRNKDHTKMTMRELIYYLPATNPMKSFPEDEQRAEIDLPASPEAAPAVQSTTEETVAEEEEERGGGGEEEEPMLAPRVKVAEDGSLIIDETSLTVEVQRMKGPNPMEERDPIFERGSTTTYSSFRKGTYTKPWSSRETDMFFLAISMVGTDFSMIGQLFPHRARVEIKNKFKKEERTNSWRIDKAFKEKQRLDLDFFNKLLAQILKDEEKKRSKKKHTSQMASVHTRRPGERKRNIYSSESEEDECCSSDTIEGEKENENVFNDKGSSAGQKKKRGEVPQKRSKLAGQSVEQEVEEEAERSISQESSPVYQLDSVEKAAESFGLNVVRRWRNRGPVAQRKAHDTHTTHMEEYGKEFPSDYSDDEEEHDLATIQEHILNKPTRSGRIPKLSQHMIRAAADEEDDEEVEQLPPLPLRRDAQPQGSQAKQGRGHTPHRGKSRLLTLRALGPEDDDDDDDDDEEDYGINRDDEIDFSNFEEENQAFVPMGLRSVKVVPTDVEETMEELEISVNVPDALGISRNALCPESSCEIALTPMGSVHCEHQLDLLVDVIDFLAPDHKEVSEEAARTLLTIGHSALMAQTGDLSSTDDIIIIEEPPSQVEEQVIIETMDQSKNMFETTDTVISDPFPTITSEAVPVSTMSTGDKTLPPAPLWYSPSMAEPVISQENQVPCREIQPETSKLIVLEQTTSKTQRNFLHKPNLSRAFRTTQREFVEAGSSSAETFSAPVKADIEAQTLESQISVVKDFIYEKPSETGTQEQNSEACEERGNNRTEGRSPVLLFEKKMEDGGSGNTPCVEDERKEEMQQTHSESTSHSSVKPPQLVRRCRGPKPKPNLMRSIRTPHPITHNHPAVPDVKQAAVNTLTDTQQSEDGTRIIPEPERVHAKNPVMVIADANPQEHLQSVCESLTSESVFILSLTEVLPTLREGVGLVTNNLPLPATSGMLTDPISAIENATVGSAGPAGDNVFSQLLPNALIPISEEQETENRENEITASLGPDEASAQSHKTEGNAREADFPAKRRNVPERGRRAKLQIKPNTIQRRTCRDLLSLDETRSTPALACEKKLEETEPQDTSLTVVSSVASAEHSSSTILDKNSRPSTASSQDSSVISPTPGTSSSSSQDIVDTNPTEPSGSGSGTTSQVVHQITPLASTGPLMRPGRRPKGFLSFMSSTSKQKPSESTRTPQKPTVMTSRSERIRATPSTSVPPPAPPPHVSSHTPGSSMNPSASEEDEEPMGIAAYFFNDIFTVVDEHDEID